MSTPCYRHGLHDLGNGTWAWMQPDGTWGWSNAGLVTDSGASLLVDTLFDEHLTRKMLDAMRDAAGTAAGDIGTLVNTHANGDHTFGNRLVENARILASEASAREMEDVPPAMLAQMMAATDQLGELGGYLQHCFGQFTFDGIPLTPPTETFSGELQVAVGDKSVHLIEVGPAHTQGDILAWVPDDDVLYTGDILFIESTPIMWAGPVGNWLRALERILAIDASTIVPGHGPITDRAGVQRVHDYLSYIDREARARFEAGMSSEEAAFDIALGDYSSWGDAERIAVNVDTLYREYRGDDSPIDVMRLFTLMAALHKARPRGA
ncbi:MAG: MBL fold metallo-hydrolase [Pseudomonadota bacterium]